MPEVNQIAQMPWWQWVAVLSIALPYAYLCIRATERSKQMIRAYHERQAELEAQTQLVLEF